MGHTAAIYSVVVRPRGKPDDLLPFGDIDEQGTYLGDVFQEIFTEAFAVKNAKTGKSIDCVDATLDGDDLELQLRHGEGDIAAEILDGNGEKRIDQVPDDTQVMNCGALFRLVKNESRGWFAVHLNSGRHVKGMLEVELVKRFEGRFSELKLEIKPSVQGKVLDEALENGHLQSVKLIRYEKPSDAKDAGKWVAADTSARIELRIRPVARAKKMLPNLVKKALGGDNNALKQIVVYDGMTFNQAKVEVAVDGASHRRTFNLQDLKAGHPFTADIDPITEAGVPKPESIFEELGNVIDEMT